VSRIKAKMRRVFFSIVVAKVDLRQMRTLGRCQQDLTLSQTFNSHTER